MTMKIAKTAIAIVLLSLFSAFSIVYISWNVWNNFKLNQMRTAATQGYQQAIIDVELRLTNVNRLAFR